MVTDPEVVLNDFVWKLNICYLIYGQGLVINTSLIVSHLQLPCE